MATLNADADKLDANIIKALPLPPKGNKFHGYSGKTAQGLKAPGGFGVVVTAGGSRSFVLNYRFRGRERRYTIGRFGTWPVPAAIKQAIELRRRIDAGDDPLEARASVTTPAKELTITDIFNKWLASPRRKDKPSRAQISSFHRHVLPAIGDVPYREHRKSRVGDMYDVITVEAGPIAANRTVTYLQSVLSWQEGRTDDWTAPSFKKIKAENKEVARSRWLSDEEIVALWPAFADADLFGKLCQLLLLTGQRRSDMAELRRPEIDLERHTATIPATRYKTGIDHIVPLTERAVAILSALPRRRDDRVFPVFNFDLRKTQIDAKVQLGERWTLHDLRRTAKTLMARAGVLPHISERVLGHVQGKIEGTYDRHDYLDEKRDALEKLATSIDRIVDPLTDNVVELRKAAQV